MDTERHDEDHDRGLELDLPTILSRRRALQLLGGAGLGAGLLAVVGCGSSGATSSPTTAAVGGGSSTASASTATDTTASSAGTGTTMAATTASDEACTTLPEETAGPYPGDGSNGPDVLGESGVVRSDITSSFGGMSGTADGVPLVVRLKVLDVAGGCVPTPGAAVYLWHCDAQGRYSLYSAGVTDQNYLRGVQVADDDGRVEFTTIFPAAYSGRWPHIHFEVYESLDDASNARGKVLTSQLALPQDVCEQVYATSGYPGSSRNLASTSLSRDNVFSDGWTTQLATVTGDPASGYVAELDCGI